MAKQTFTTGQVLTAAQMTSLQQTAMLGGDANARTASYVLVAGDAGNAVSMNSSSPTTITVNNSIFAAGDIVTIINLGTGICTITAGTATVATSGSLALAQNQGGVLRFTSASAAIFFQFATPASGDIEGVTAGTGISGGGTSGTVTITNSMATAIDAKGDLIVGTGADTFSRLAVGTNGHTLVADSATATGLKWAAPSSGGMTELATGTLSGSQVDITSISGSYNDLVLIVRNYRPNTDGSILRMRLNADTGTSYLANAFNSTDNNETPFNAQLFSISPGVDSTTNNGITYVKLFDYANAVTWKMGEMFSLASGDVTVTSLSNRKVHLLSNISAAITQINLFPSGGTFNGGTYILYGVR